MMGRRNRRRRWPLRLLLVVIVLWLAGVAAYIVWVGARNDAGPADAIIVLGAAAYDAKPSPVFAARLQHAVALYEAGNAPSLIVTGGFGTGARFSESQVGQRYAERHGVPGSAILIETTSRTTYENLVQARKLMQDHGLHRAIIVSDPLHMARALRLCRELRIEAVGSPTPSTRFRGIGTRADFLMREVYFFHRDLLTGSR